MTAAYFRLIVRRFGTTPALGRALLAPAGDATEAARVRDDADAEIAVATQLRQLERLGELACAGAVSEAWGLELGATLDGMTHGPAGVVLATAPTLAAALDAMARYVTVRAPFIDLRVIRPPGRYGFRLVEPCPLGFVRTAVLELVLLSVQGGIESALGRRLDAGAFVMPASAPAYRQRYPEFFHAAVAFQGAAAEISVPDAWLDLPCPLADPPLHRAACARLEAMRQRLVADFADTGVERILAASDDAGPSLREVAARLGLSPRTLVRRLEHRRTSYRTLLDGHRRRRAALLLAQAELTVAEVADRLGYDEPSNFGRACRRWFGMSPRRYRASVVAPRSA
jgi:AraC-like DNA-binding protein